MTDDDTKRLCTSAADSLSNIVMYPGHKPSWLLVCYLGKMFNTAMFFLQKNEIISVVTFYFNYDF